MHPGLLALISWFVKSVHFTAGYADLFPAVVVITPGGISFVVDVYQTKTLEKQFTRGDEDVFDLMGNLY